MNVSLKTPQDIEKMRVAGRLASEVLDFITPHVKQGVTTEKLDQLCHDYIVNVQGTIPAPLNYAPPGHRPYPKSICTSVNHQVCHGIPGEKVLKHGDVINIDVTVIKDGYHGDTSRMFYIGEPSIQARRLCESTFESMWRGISQVSPGPPHDCSRAPAASNSSTGGAARQIDRVSFGCSVEGRCTTQT